MHILNGKTLVIGVKPDMSIAEVKRQIKQMHAWEDQFACDTTLVDLILGDEMLQNDDTVAGVGLSPDSSVSALFRKHVFWITGCAPPQQRIYGEKDLRGFGEAALAIVEVPHSETEVREDAFKGCNDLAEVTIPDSVKRIGQRAFQGCRSLRSVTIPNSVLSRRTSGILWRTRVITKASWGWLFRRPTTRQQDQINRLFSLANAWGPGHYGPCLKATQRTSVSWPTTNPGRLLRAPSPTNPSPAPGTTHLTNGSVHSTGARPGLAGGPIRTSPPSTLVGHPNARNTSSEKAGGVTCTNNISKANGGKPPPSNVGSTPNSSARLPVPSMMSPHPHPTTERF